MKKKSSNWRPDCFRVVRPSGDDLLTIQPSPAAAPQDDYTVPTTHSVGQKSRSLPGLREEATGVTIVQLCVTHEPDLGMIIAGGSDSGGLPYVASLTPEGLAERSDRIEVGDEILSVNDTATADLQHSDIIMLLTVQPHSTVTLGIKYGQPEPLQNLTPTVAKCSRIAICRDDSSCSFGFVLRGGVNSDLSVCRPLVVTHIRSGSAADRDGRLKVGDRILEINGADATKVPLSEAYDMLMSVNTSVSMLVEYNVSVIEAVQNASGPLLVEIDRPFCCSLGIDLSAASHRGRSVICISNIVAASIADRCGALHVGDQVLSINDVALDSASVSEAMRQLQCDAGDQLVLEILPKIRSRAMRMTSAASSLSTNSSITSVSSIDHYASIGAISNRSDSMATQVGSAVGDHKLSSVMSVEHQTTVKRGSSVTSVVSSLGNYPYCRDSHACHIDVTDVTLVTDIDDTGDGCRQFGIQIDSFDHSADGFLHPPFISRLEPGSVAERCGLLQEGDRVLAVNGWSLKARTLRDVTEMIAVSRRHLTLRIEFDVAESVVSSTGTYLVKMAKRGAGVGISISCPRNRTAGQPLVISDVKKGSIAHRTGTISPGDYLLAIGDVWLDNHSLEEAARVLTAADKVVKLRIQKNECYADEPDPKSVITYNVELPRFAGRLGISLCNAVEPPGTVVIASLTADGLAEKTGALRVGDRILAINGVALRGRNVEEAVRLLPTNDDSINIKVMRHLSPAAAAGVQKDGIGSGLLHSHVVNLDSVLESWDGWGHDYNVTRSVIHHRLSVDGKLDDKTPKNSDSHSAGSGEVFCDLDHHGGRLDHHGGRRRSSGTTHSLPSPGVMRDRPRPQRGSRREHVDTATAVAGSFRPDTGESPSRIDASNLTAIPGRGIATSTALDDQLEVSAAAGDWPSSSLRHSVASPPHEELVQTTLQRSDRDDGFGFSLSNGVYDSGVYVGAVKEKGPAADKLLPYDRILKVNGEKVIELTCAEVVPLIARSGPQLDLVVSRRPADVQSTDSPAVSADVTAAAKQFHVVANSSDTKSIKEDDV